MNIIPINCSPSFSAIKVRKIEPLFKTNDVTFYNNATAMFKHPKPLFDGVTCFIDAITHNIAKKVDTFLDIFDITRLTDMLKFLPKDTFRNRLLKGIVGAGLYNTALLLDNDEVLCLSGNMDIFETRPFEDFDLPIKSKGIYPASDDQGWYIRSFGLPVNKTELAKLAKKIKSKGYELDDWRTEQACKINGEIYLLDYECAIKPTS